MATVFAPERAIAGIPRLNRDGPQKKQKRANLALSSYKTAGLTQA